MGLFDKLKFVAWDNAGTVADLIGKWSPQGCKTEKDYEKSLYAFLHEQLGDVPVVKQFARGRMKADIVVGEKVILELKNDLDTTGKLQRLIGQLETYVEWNGPVIVLLTGTTEPNLLQDLKKKVKDLNGRGFDPIAALGGSERFRVLEK